MKKSAYATPSYSRTSSAKNPVTTFSHVVESKN